jgi:peptidoglycan lytic transglycosylase G
MAESEDWLADSEGNLTPPPSELKPDTDEFGRDDPATLERERRRREREARRKGGSSKGEQRPARRAGRRESGGGGMLSRLGRGRKPRSEPPAARAPAAEASAAPEAPPAPARSGAREAPAAPVAPDERAATRGSAAVSLRQRLRRGGGAGGETPTRGRIRRRRILAIVAAVVVLLLAWFLVALFQPFAGEGLGEGRVAVNIPANASASEVADLLAGKGVVSNATLFKLRLRLSGKEDELVHGPLAMASGMSYSAAIDRLTGESSEAGKLVTPEGYSREQLAPLVEAAGIEGDYLADTKSHKGFDPAMYGAAKAPNLEGFLFPATYDVTPGETTEDLVAEQLQAFKANLKRVDLSYAEKKGNLTPYDVLIIASMIDREVQVEKERPLVAAVIWNRLHKGEPLGIDATTRYEYNNWDKAITQAQLDKDTPFNTRLNAGLPPTPIGNPGLASIKAAARPANVNYLFYVVKPGTCPATHSFTSSEAEFNQLVAKYNKARAEAGNKSPTC